MSEHVYEGKPDERQGDAETKTSRFRPRYRALHPMEKELHDQIKAKADELDALMAQVSDDGERGRYNALATTALEQSVMWSVKALTM